MTQKFDPKVNWFKRVLAKYDKFCHELGIDQGTCRGCVPIVKFDPERQKVENTDKKNKD
ncbi:MAG: DUF5363 domain-containing protein [Pasteurellaceae bacterium]|nr:DUF5363 domain-containing protein [Pasteurellaceae bacterium]